MSLEKTQLKLCVSKRNGELIGFVSKHPKTQKLMGVREDSMYGKKICVLSEHLNVGLYPDKLYEVDLKPMHTGRGYVVVKAEPVEFLAHIEKKISSSGAFLVTITFGNKVVYYDPINGRSASSNTIEGVVELLNSRSDLKNVDDVIVSFRKAADELHAKIYAAGFEDAVK